MRSGLPSTLIRWAFSSKTHRRENALESGSKWIEKAYISYKRGRSKTAEWKRWRHIYRRVFVACTQSSTYVTTCNSIVFERFSADSQKRMKKVVWTPIHRCVFYDNENAFFWKRISVDRALGLSRYTNSLTIVLFDGYNCYTWGEQRRRICRQWNMQWNVQILYYWNLSFT